MCPVENAYSSSICALIGILQMTGCSVYDDGVWQATGRLPRWIGDDGHGLRCPVCGKPLDVDGWPDESHEGDGVLMATERYPCPEHHLHLDVTVRYAAGGAMAGDYALE